MHDLLAILGLGLACGAWMLIQRWRARSITGPTVRAPGAGCGDEALLRGERPREATDGHAPDRA